MQIDRRQFLSAGGLALTGCRAMPAPGRGGRPTRLDRLLAAHRDVLPESAGGANHFPMAAEVLEAFGHEDAIDDAWIDGARLYAGELPRRAPVVGETAPLGVYDRFGDLRDHFDRELRAAPWREVVRRWAPLLAPGLSGALFHGLIRTGHAVRALATGETDARRGELAVALAYWAARWRPLPTGAGGPLTVRDAAALAALEYRSTGSGDEQSDVPFGRVMDRLTAADDPVATAVCAPDADEPAAASLSRLVCASAAALLEMLVQRRHRIWLLHAVTGPAAIDLLWPALDEPGARALVAHAHQAVLALFRAYGGPFSPGAHVRPTPAAWSSLVAGEVDRRSVHGIKLVDALRRFDDGRDTLMRSVAEQWSEWK